ncbi:hypothetical protein ACU8KH_04305 [Lachancea thermotolerans]
MPVITIYAANFIEWLEVHWDRRRYLLYTLVIGTNTSYCAATLSLSGLRFVFAVKFQNFPDFATPALEVLFEFRAAPVGSQYSF